MRLAAMVTSLALVSACATAPGSRASDPSAAGAPAAATLGPPEREVLAVLQRLFDAMRAGDSAAVRDVFEPGARLQTVAERQGIVRISEDSLGSFVRMVGTPHPKVFDERIANERVLIDGPYAVAWVDYTFYLGEEKSHCGVDAFQLVRRPVGWRIFGLTDTRRRQSCPDLPRP